MSTYRLHVVSRPGGRAGGADAAVTIEAPSLRHAQAFVLGRAAEHFGEDAASAWMIDEDGRRVWSLQIDDDPATEPPVPRHESCYWASPASTIAKVDEGGSTR